MVIIHFRWIAAAECAPFVWGLSCWLLVMPLQHHTARQTDDDFYLPAYSENVQQGLLCYPTTLLYITTCMRVVVYFILRMVQWVEFK